MNQILEREREYNININSLFIYLQHLCLTRLTVDRNKLFPNL